MNEERARVIPTIPEKTQPPVAMTEATSPRPARRAVQPQVKGPNRLIFVAVFALGIAIGGGVIHARDHADHIITSVNGINITQDQFFKRLQTQSGAAVIHQMVQEELQLQYAKKMGFFPSASLIEQRYEKDARQPNFQDYLATSGQSVDDYKRTLQVRYAQAAAVTQNVNVSDAEVHKYYNDNIDKHNPQAQFYLPDTASIEIVVTQTEDAAQEAQRQLLNGLDFKLVARRYSIDESYKDGGQIAPIQRGRSNFSHVPGMDDAIFNLNIGQTLGPQKFDGRWWIVHCLDKTAAITRPFDMVKEEAKIGAQLTKGITHNAKKIETDFDTFQQSSNIQAFWPRYESAVTSK